MCTHNFSSQTTHVTLMTSGMCARVMKLSRKEDRNSLVAQDRIGVCQMQTNMNKKACKHMTLRAHTRNEARSTDKKVCSQVLIFFITHKSDTSGFLERDPTRFLGIEISIISAFYNERGASHSISTVSNSPRSTLNPTHILDVRIMY